MGLHQKWLLLPPLPRGLLHEPLHGLQSPHSVLPQPAPLLIGGPLGGVFFKTLLRCLPDAKGAGCSMMMEPPSHSSWILPRGIVPTLSLACLVLSRSHHLLLPALLRSCSLTQNVVGPSCDFHAHLPDHEFGTFAPCPVTLLLIHEQRHCKETSHGLDDLDVLHH